MRAYRLFLIFGALTLIGLGATILVQGGWQAAAAGLAALNGVGFVLTFAVLGARSERARPREPSWARAADHPRRLAPETAAHHPEMSRPQPSGRRSLPARRPRPVGAG